MLTGRKAVPSQYPTAISLLPINTASKWSSGRCRHYQRQPYFLRRFALLPIDFRHGLSLLLPRRHPKKLHEPCALNRLGRGLDPALTFGGFHEQLSRLLQLRIAMLEGLREDESAGLGERLELIDVDAAAPSDMEPASKSLKPSMR
jgi:hypothetical protein